MPAPNNIEIRSEEVQEIIGTPPAKIIRVGISSIFVLIIILFVGSFFFKYPDIIDARITVKGENPSADLKARSSGKITDLFVTDNQQVKKGQTIAIIENTCNYSDLQKLKSEIDSLEGKISNTEDFISSYKPNKAYHLGELQSDYWQFYREIKKYKEFLSINYHEKKIKALIKQKRARQNYMHNLKRQLSLTKNDLNLSEKQFQRDSVLHTKEFLSETEYEKSKSNVLQKKNALADSRNSISNSEIRIAEIEQQILETKLDKIDQKRDYEISIIETFENLKAQIKLWEQSFLLISPIKGNITFTNFHHINQNVSVGETIFTIVPDKVSELTGYAEVPLSGSGKVKPGQNVNIKFDDFPDTQFGMVRGKVKSMSMVQTNEFYIVKVSFPDSLNTNYKKTLPFKQNMKGNAEIMTDELPLIARIVNPIKSLFYEKIK